MKSKKWAWGILSLTIQPCACCACCVPFLQKLEEEERDVGREELYAPPEGAHISCCIDALSGWFLKGARASVAALIGS